jgi:hypothetical protein
MRKPVSVTLDQDNIIWLKGRAIATARGSLSEVLDRIVTAARLEGRTEPEAIQSVVGMIELPEDDPDLEKAHAEMVALFEESAQRTHAVLVRERAPRRPARSNRKRKAAK